MIRKKAILAGAIVGVIICIIISLTGCTVKKEVSEDSSFVASVNSPSPSPTPYDCNAIVGQRKEIVSDNKVVGTVRVNKIERIGISDWTITECVKNAINYSYAINLTVNFENLLQEVGNVTLKCEPALVDESGRIVGKACDVGWSGFPKSAELTSSSYSKCIEVNVQPLSRVKKCKLVLRFSDSEGRTYSSIELGNGQLKNATKGPKLLSSGEHTVIKSVTGAKYWYEPKKVYFEYHYVKDKTYGDGDPYFDIEYQAVAAKGPINNRNVDNVVVYKGKPSLNSIATLGLQTNASSTILYDSDSNAVRTEFSDDTRLYPYVSRNEAIGFGKRYTMTTNRQAGESNKNSPRFVRVRVEYPEEARVMSDKKLRNFSGRYVVYQLKISERKMPKMYE